MVSEGYDEIVFNMPSSTFTAKLHIYLDLTQTVDSAVRHVDNDTAAAPYSVEGTEGTEKGRKRGSKSKNAIELKSITTGPLTNTSSTGSPGDLTRQQVVPFELHLRGDLARLKMVRDHIKSQLRQVKKKQRRKARDEDSDDDDGAAEDDVD